MTADVERNLMSDFGGHSRAGANTTHDWTLEVKIHGKVSSFSWIMRGRVVGVDYNYTIFYHVCQGLFSHYFHIIGDGHQPNSRGLYTHYKDSY